MGLAHTIMVTRTVKWTLSDTATYFNVSIGLVSENIKLHKALEDSPKIQECKTREQALRRLVNGAYLETNRFKDTH